ncbi:MAG: hypothetical protein QNJ88_18065 [Acidimicrobiia bacterium]|nr:hypothetical protein [Acidimicrobiia bacterium]
MAEEQVEFQAEAKIRRNQTIRVLVVLIIATVLTALAVDNLHEVAVDWVFGSSEAPLVVVIVISTVGGMIIGALLRRRRP